MLGTLPALSPTSSAVPHTAAAAIAATTAAARATATATTTVAAAASAATAAAGGTWPRLVDIERTPIDLLTVQSLDGGTGLGVVTHRDERETSRPTRVAVRDDGHLVHFAMFGEEITQGVLVGPEAHVPNKDLHDFKYPLVCAHDGD